MTKRTRHNIYKTLIFAVAILIVLIPMKGGGDTSTRIVISAMGLDSVDGSIVASLEAVSKENETLVGSGATLRLALNDVNEREGRTAELAHCGLIVLGSDISTADAMLCINDLLSEGRLNAGCTIICADTSAREFMSNAIKIESNSGGMSDYITFMDEKVHIANEKVIAFAGKVNSKSQAVSVPILSIKDKEGDTGSSQSTNSSESGGAQAPESGKPTKEVMLTRTEKIFGRKEGILPERESRGHSWLVKENGTGYTSVSDFVFDGKSYGALSAEIVEKSGGVNVTGANSAEISVEVKLHAANRFKMLSPVLEFEKKPSEIIAAVTEQFTDEIRADVEAFVEFCKTEKIDLMCVCRSMYKYRPKDLRDIDSTMESMEFSINIKVDVY